MVGLGCGVGVVPELVLQKSQLRDRVQVTSIAPNWTPSSSEPAPSPAIWPIR